MYLRVTSSIEFEAEVFKCNKGQPLHVRNMSCDGHNYIKIKNTDSFSLFNACLFMFLLFLEGKQINKKIKKKV